MFRTPLRLLAIGCSLLIGAGWLMFALDESRSASETSAQIVAGNDAATRADLSPDEERAREEIHSDAREYVDDANDILLKPFAGISADSDNKWVRRTVPAIIGLLVYGFGLGYLARFSSGRA
ncbi:MAG TPA: hypothetical protein VNT22_05735 [Baekduia sp.]|nr:hypothetical protein [Baekduia sp.]